MTNVKFTINTPDEQQALATTECERVLGVTLPPDYVSFLRTAPYGATLEPNAHRADPDNIGVDGILSLREACAIAEQLGHRVPSDSLPVAEAEGGNVVLLVIRGEAAGRVRFWWHERGVITDLNRSFDEFINDLEPVSESIHDELGVPRDVPLGRVVQSADDPEFDALLREEGIE